MNPDSQLEQDVHYIWRRRNYELIRLVLTEGVGRKKRNHSIKVVMVRTVVKRNRLLQGRGKGVGGEVYQYTNHCLEREKNNGKRVPTVASGPAKKDVAHLANRGGGTTGTKEKLPSRIGGNRKGLKSLNNKGARGQPENLFRNRNQR